MKWQNRFLVIHVKTVLISEGGGGVGYHDVGREAAELSQSLADVSIISGSSNLLLRLHGAFMIGAWIGAAGIGILLARYFKQTWVRSQLCGKDQWFAVSCPISVVLGLKFGNT